jgi:hypothetical protein
VAFITLTIRLSGSATVRRLGRIEHKRAVDYPLKRDLVPLYFRDAKQKGLAALVRQNIISDKEIYFAWYHVLNTYSSRMISFDDDKITAIGGIPGIISQPVEGELVEGIWKNDLARGLLWTVKLGSPISERRTTLRGPIMELDEDPWSYWILLVLQLGLEGHIMGVAQLRELLAFSNNRLDADPRRKNYDIRALSSWKG